MMIDLSRRRSPEAMAQVREAFVADVANDEERVTDRHLVRGARTPRKSLVARRGLMALRSRRNKISISRAAQSCTRRALFTQ